jgi:hypothetical protein
MTHVGTCVSLVKQPGTSASTLNTTVKNHHVIEENENQYGGYQIIFEEVNTLLILCKKFHSIRQIILTLHHDTLIFSFWELCVVKMFVHCSVIYKYYMLRIPIKD